MSAFMVNKDHIDLLVSAAVNWRCLDFYRANQFPGAPDKHDVDQVGTALWAENARSLTAAYGKRGCNEMAGDQYRTGYRYRDLQVRGGANYAVTILKACNCFDYQACETDDYHSTWAAKWIDNLRGHALHKLPGYDEADGWDYVRKGDEPISLMAMSRRRIR